MSTTAAAAVTAATFPIARLNALGPALCLLHGTATAALENAALSIQPTTVATAIVAVRAVTAFARNAAWMCIQAGRPESAARYDAVATATVVALGHLGYAARGLEEARVDAIVIHALGKLPGNLAMHTMHPYSAGLAVRADHHMNEALRHAERAFACADTMRAAVASAASVIHVVTKPTPTAP